MLGIEKSSLSRASQEDRPMVVSIAAERANAFTLIELLVVISIVAILLGLLVPAFNAIKGGGDVSTTAYEMAGVFEQARAYAMSNRTYVFVGITEVDVSKPDSLMPQIPGNGRVAMAVVASKNGTRGYDVATPATWSTNYASATMPNLVALCKLRRFDNSHLSTVLNGQTPAVPLPTTGNMARPAQLSNNYVIGRAPTSQTPFDWPLGSTLSTGQYSFKSVISFDPQGMARIQYSTNGDTIVTYIEIGLQPTHGNVTPPNPPNQNVGLQAAIQIDAMTGGTRIYRP